MSEGQTNEGFVEGLPIPPPENGGPPLGGPPHGGPGPKLPPSPPPLSHQDEPSKPNPEKTEEDSESAEPERAVWGNQLEFLMSCIATSVGLGNVWRFPFVAYGNGGGAFLIPYIIVLFIVGKPMYYIECVLGQFSSKNSVKVWAVSPAMKGTGYAQALGCGYILTYYVSIIALCLYYLAMSFQSTLPWGVCDPAWGENCVPTDPALPAASPGANTSSAELYFVNTVLQQRDGIEGGIGWPVWYLTLCLFASWFMIFVIVSQGVKSSGKASYFLAIFPYVIMIILLIRATTLEGAGKGVLFFLTPQWAKLLELSVWYAATTQVFFSLSVCTGAIIMFSSYNGFRQNVARDSMIVTTLDTFTSLMSGITIFAVLGNLAHELGVDNINEVIKGGGTGLAFISYPDAISKSPFAPQLFAVLFFLMMVVLGFGSAVALLSTINTVLMDSFPRLPVVVLSAFCCIFGFLVGLVYVTPGGQYVLELVDHYGGTFLVLFSAIAEIIGLFWIYGLENMCEDIEFMLEGRKTSVYWRWCWGIITPLLMIIVFFYSLTDINNLTFGEDYTYPNAAYVSGYFMLFTGMALVPIFIANKLRKSWSGNFKETWKLSFRQKESWGPKSAVDRRDWVAMKEEAKAEREKLNKSHIGHIWASLNGTYRRRS